MREGSKELLKLYSARKGTTDGENPDPTLASMVAIVHPADIQRTILQHTVSLPEKGTVSLSRVGRMNREA